MSIKISWASLIDPVKYSDQCLLLHLPHSGLLNERERLANRKSHDLQNSDIANELVSPPFFCKFRVALPICGMNE